MPIKLPKKKILATAIAISAINLIITSTMLTATIIGDNHYIQFCMAFFIWELQCIVVTIMLFAWIIAIWLIKKVMDTDTKDWYLPD